MKTMGRPNINMKKITKKVLNEIIKRGEDNFKNPNEKVLSIIYLTIKATLEEIGEVKVIIK